MTYSLAVDGIKINTEEIADLHRVQADTTASNVKKLSKDKLGSNIKANILLFYK